MLNAASLMLSAPYRAHSHAPRCPVGRRLAPEQVRDQLQAGPDALGDDVTG